MSTQITSDSTTQIVSTGGQKASFTFGDQGDFVISNPARKSEGRAMVVWTGDQLVINYDNDFKGGVVINGLQLGPLFKDLPLAPSGTNVFDIVVDANGNLYRQD